VWFLFGILAAQINKHREAPKLRKPHLYVELFLVEIMTANVPAFHRSDMASEVTAGILCAIGNDFICPVLRHNPVLREQAVAALVFHDF